MVTPCRRGLLLLAGGLSLGLGLAWWQGQPRPAASLPSRPPVLLTEAPPPMLDEDAILALRPEAPTLLRLAGEERVFVLVFPALAPQAAAMNRIAALVEKAGFPRDRLATHDELASAIAARGEAPHTWYLAHDYSGADLDRFFTLASQGGAGLGPEERWLQAQLPRLRQWSGGQDFALLTLTAETGPLDEALRAAILRHEVAHGWFFSRPDFAAAVLGIWRDAFKATERDGFRAFLAQEGYDTESEQLVANEAMAYLAFTPEPRLFDPARHGFSTDRLATLRALYQAARR